MMNTSVCAQIAKSLRDVHTGGNWTVSSLDEHVSGLTWQQATTRVRSFNTIAALVYHIHYYVAAALKVLQGGALDASDKYSFSVPVIQSQKEWEELITRSRTDAVLLAMLIEELPDSRLSETFCDEKYGTYYRNLAGIVEHAHYHLGQIVLIRKFIPEQSQS